jgi:hypothetical protein
LITFAAPETVDDEDGVTPEIRCAPLVFVSVSGAGETAVGADAVLLAAGAWLPTDGGATNAADGGTELALVGVGDSLVATATEGFAGPALFGLSAPVVTGADSEVDGATNRGAGD